MRQTTRPLSPCVSQCKLDAEKTQCQACGRTIDEIRQWRTMSDDQKEVVWLRLAAEGRLP